MIDRYQDIVDIKFQREYVKNLKKLHQGVVTMKKWLKNIYLFQSKISLLGLCLF